MAAALTLPQARRIALAAQGLSKFRPTGPADTRAVGRTFDRLQLVQIDSVNVLTRSHFMPFFSRLGVYDRDVLRRFSSTPPRRMVEYWAHEASFIRPIHFADLRLWQRRSWVGAGSMDPKLKGSLEERILQALAPGRPLTARQVTEAIDHQETRTSVDWGWNWNAAKRVLEDMFEQGTIGAAGRTEQFERRYALIDRVIPVNKAVTDPDPEQAMRRLLAAAAAAHGIGTLRCFADYFRLPMRPAALAVSALVDEGVLEPVEVKGWQGSVYLHREAAKPRKVTGRALLSPFDSLVFERRRLEQLFGFHYRIEIYTPAARRRYGYYVLPFLLGEVLVARVDLKADRQRGVLVVRAAHAEPGAPPSTAAELADELRLMADWLGLDQVLVEPVGDLATALAGAVRCSFRT